MKKNIFNSSNTHILKYNYKNYINRPILYAPKSIEKIYEINVIKKLLKFNCSKHTFVDVGAHIGFYSILYSYFFKKVYAFEPSIFQSQYLKHNKKNFGFGALAEIRILTHLKYCSSLNLMYFYPFPLSEEIRYDFKG